MRPEFGRQLLQQLSDVVEAYERALGDKSSLAEALRNGADLPALPHLAELEALSRAAIERAAPVGSIYSLLLSSVLDSQSPGAARVDELVALAKAFRHDVDKGYIGEVEESVRCQVFDDFLGTAQQMLDDGHAPAAAILSGSALETHLRQLAKKYGIGTVRGHDGGAGPRATDALNAALAQAGAYEVSDCARVGAWLGLRDDAAQGNYDRIDREQVASTILEIREFMDYTPA